MVIAVVNSSQLDDADVVLFVAACNAQVTECAAAWGVEPTPVVFYSDAKGLPQADCRIMDIVDDLEQPGALGFHTDDAGLIYGRVLAQGRDTSITLSHEVLEELIDPTCAAWRPMGGGKSVALEVCDPVEGDSYYMAATVATVERDIALSNYVLPRWFDPAAPGGLDRMQILAQPLSMSPGGYMVVQDAQGNESDVFARRVRFGGWPARAAVGQRVANPDGRLRRRLGR